MGLQFVFTHSLHLTPPGLCVAWSFVTLQVFAPKPQPQEDFPKPAIAKGALPTGHHPGFLTVSFSSLCVFETGSLAQASLELQALELAQCWNYKHIGVYPAALPSSCVCQLFACLFLPPPLTAYPAIVKVGS